MSFSQKIAIAINVLKDWRAIFVLILAIIICSLANYVVRYTKKPALPKPVKKAPKVEAKPAEAAAPAEGDAAE